MTQTIADSPHYVGDGGFIAQALNATSIEEATATGEVWKAEQNYGVRFRFDGAVFLDSDLGGKLPLFALCDVVNVATGEVGKLSVGGDRVVATLFKAASDGWFPFDASIEPVALGQGMSAQNLVLAPRVVKSTKAS